MREPATVAVDLTPVLPGGENGGAKVFALALVRELARLAPGARFILLTQAATHEELASLDAGNVRRIRVIGPTAAAGRAGLFDAAARVVRRLPAWARVRAARAGYLLNTAFKRSGPRLLRDLGVDLLFCPFTAPAFREPAIPVVCTIYDVQFRDYPQFFEVEDVAQRERAFRDACRHATRLAAISEHSRAAAIAHGGLEPGRIRAIPLAAHLSASGPVPAQPTERAPYLLYPANFWRHKNHEMLLTAFGMACRSGLPEALRLVCTGAPGPRRDRLAAAARAMGLGERVAFPGFVEPGEYAALLAGSRGLVFPSLYEGFGLPVIEAMAANVPVACSGTTALPEVAGEAALLFDPRIPDQIAGAMVALATDEVVRGRLVEAGRRRAAAHPDVARMAAAYWALFGESLGGGDAKAAA